VGDIDLSLLGHGYFAHNRAVLTDIHQLLLQDTAPDKRMGLRKQIIKEGNYNSIVK